MYEQEKKEKEKWIKEREKEGKMFEKEAKRVGKKRRISGPILQIEIAKELP